MECTGPQSRRFSRKDHRQSWLGRQAIRKALNFEFLETRCLLDGGGLLPDRFEPNDLQAEAAAVGVAPGVHLSELSIHGTSDIDWYSFRILRSDSIDIQLTFDSNVADLAITVYDAAGSTSRIWQGSSPNQILFSSGVRREDLLSPVTLRKIGN